MQCRWPTRHLVSLLTAFRSPLWHRESFRKVFLPTFFHSCRLAGSAIQPSSIWDLNEKSPKDVATDTIYALSTAFGRSAIAVIRISGSACLSVYTQLCPDRTPLKPRTASLRILRHPRNRDDILDTGALVLYFPSPNTVTGEDVLELHVHGGPAIVRSILEAIPQCAADQKTIIRHAEAGEFTKRAFYNDRIDLTQAEALGESLVAETEQQRRLAISGTSSTLAVRYEEWRNMLLYARGELEALIDFSEDQHFDESPMDFIASVSKQVVDLRDQIQLHLQNASRGELLRDGIRVALLGPPNVGKSSLLNRIVGREAAIVSAEEGTTRDIVDVTVDIGGWLVRLGDMAGLRSSPTSSNDFNIYTVGAVEREGIRRARKHALESDLVIVLLSLQKTPKGSIELTINDELCSTVRDCQNEGKHIIFGINKIDLLHTQNDFEKKSLSYFLSRFMEIFPDTSPNNVFCLSCKGAEVLNSNESDPGGIQTFLSGLTKTFSSMTAALTGEDPVVSMSTAEAQSYWTASLSVTHRQTIYLKDCLDHLYDFLSIANRRSLLHNDASSGLVSTHLVDGHADLVAVRTDRMKALHEHTTSESEFDVVTAAEHLRYAADCLANITGKAIGGDVEDILGVVFEK